MSTSTPDGSDEWLEQVLKYLVDNVELIRHRVELRHMKPADGFTHNERLKSDSKAAILKHEAAEKLKLLENVQHYIVDSYGFNWYPADFKAFMETEIARLRKEVE